MHMRKMKKVLVAMALLMLPAIPMLPGKVFAAGGISVSTNSISLAKGETKSFTITASNAAGRVDISSSNPAVASVSQESAFLDMGSTSVTVSGGAAGTATISVRATDMTTYDDEDLSGRTYSISVTVTEPAKPSGDGAASGGANGGASGGAAASGASNSSTSGSAASNAKPSQNAAAGNAGNSNAGQPSAPAAEEAPADAPEELEDAEDEYGESEENYTESVVTALGSAMSSGDGNEKSDNSPLMVALAVLATGEFVIIAGMLAAYFLKLRPAKRSSGSEGQI